jgi:glutathione S-transferase
MILIGQYDSPFTRRIAVSLMVLGIPFERDIRSVFTDFDAMRQINPLGRIPSLVLDDGSILIESGAILDFLDEAAGPERALLPRAGRARQEALQCVALATGLVEKAGAAAYERLIRPPRYRWPEWIERCRAQAEGALKALSRREWPAVASLDQVHISTFCALDYLRLVDPDLFPEGRYPVLDALWQALSPRPEFAATAVKDYAVPRGE